MWLNCDKSPTVASDNGKLKMKREQEDELMKPDRETEWMYENIVAGIRAIASIWIESE